MAENTPPTGATAATGVESHGLPKLDLSKLANDRRIPTPMAYNISNLDDQGRMQLISPPPEEILRRTSVSIRICNLCNVSNKLYH
jgi:hypothetical protein